MTRQTREAVVCGNEAIAGHMNGTRFFGAEVVPVTSNHGNRGFQASAITQCVLFDSNCRALVGMGRTLELRLIEADFIERLLRAAPESIEQSDLAHFLIGCRDESQASLICEMVSDLEERIAALWPEVRPVFERVQGGAAFRANLGLLSRGYEW